MITLKEFLEVISYRIGEGSEFLWDCYGSWAWNLDSHDNKFSIIHDRETQELFEVKAYDYDDCRAYRIINPKYRDAYLLEAKARGVDPNCAWDDVSFIDLETDEDWLEKARAIAAGKSYDTRVQVPIELSDVDMLHLFKLAHARDITLNKLVGEILAEHCSKLS